MNSKIKHAFKAEMHAAKHAYRDGDYQTAFGYLERAHILGQRYFITHWVTHWWMLKVALRELDFKELQGQIIRLLAVPVGYGTGWVPKGNTGGADVSAVKPMAIPEDLSDALSGYSVTFDVIKRILLFASIASIYWVISVDPKNCSGGGLADVLECKYDARMRELHVLLKE